MDVQGRKFSCGLFSVSTFSSIFTSNYLRMENALFSSLQIGRIYVCYSFTKTEVADLLQAISGVVEKKIPSFKIELLNAPAEYNGTLVARRFNLGVVCGNGGVLVAPRFNDRTLPEVADTFVKTLLDVDSLRNEDVLFLSHVVLEKDLCCLDFCNQQQTADVPQQHRSSLSFWQHLRTEADEVDYIDEVRDEPSVTVGSHTKPKALRGISRVFKSVHDFLNHKELAADNECEYYEEACAAEASVVAERDADYGPDDDVDQLDNYINDQEALAKKIADLVRLYIVRYGTIDEGKIADLLRGKMTLAANKLSHLVLNKECKLVLQDFDEVCLNLGGPSHSTVYILFLLHPEGLYLKDIGDYRAEMENVYTILSPRKDECKVKATIERISTPGDGLNQIISKIRTCLKACAPVGDVAEEYAIKGERGERYYIPIAQKEGMVTIMPKFNS